MDTWLFCMYGSYCSLVTLMTLLRDWKIYVRYGSQARTWHIDISKQGMSFGDKICEGLLRLQAFIGCDSHNAFEDEENVLAFKLKIKEPSEGQGIIWGRLGLICRTCRLKAAASAIADVNELKYQLFQAKKGDTESCQLPPCAGSYIFMTCMPITLVWKTKPGEISQYTNQVLNQDVVRSWIVINSQ